MEEKGRVPLPEHGQNSTDEPNIISMKDFTARWTKDGQKVISNATINIQPGQLTAVIGSVASGKVQFEIVFHHQPIDISSIDEQPLDVTYQWNFGRVVR